MDRTEQASYVSRPISVVSLGVWAGKVSTLVDIERAAFEVSAHYDDSPWRESHFESPLQGKSELSLIALVDGQPAAFLIASRSHGSPHIHRLAVDPTYSNGGLGSHLLATFLSTTQEDVSVFCDPDNSRALRLYADAGFQEVGANSDGKRRLALKGTSHPPRAWYIFTGTNMHSGHAAHVPQLLDRMRSGGLDITGIRYGEEGDIPSFELSLNWVSHFRQVMQTAAAQDVDIVFIRIQWKLAALFSIWARLGRGRPAIALWSSGGPGVLAGDRLSWRTRLSRQAHKKALSRVIPAIVTGPPRLLGEYQLRYGIPNDHLLLACNDIDLQRWQELAEHGSIPAQAQAWARSEGPRYLYVHGLDRIRGADRLPEIFSMLRDLHPAASLLIVGDGPLELDFDQDRVFLTGRLPNSELPAIIAEADCLLVPSRQEGFPRVLLESMALGVPPVAFDVGGCSEVVGHRLGSLITPDGDLEAFAQSADRAADQHGDSDYRQALVSRAADFDTPIVAKRLSAVLRVLGTRGRKSAAWVSQSLWVDTFPRHVDGVTK